MAAKKSNKTARKAYNKANKAYEATRTKANRRSTTTQQFRAGTQKIAPRPKVGI